VTQKANGPIFIVLLPVQLRGLKSQVARIVRLGCLVRRPTLCPRAGMELLPTDSASRLRLDTSSLQFALDDIESYLKREHGERRPTDDRGSRQDQKRRHLNLSNVAFAANHQQT
jgi:hypothetical protein